MEGLEKITQKIQSDAQKQAELIKSQAEQEAAQYLEQEQAKTAQQVDDILKNAAKEAQAMRSRMKSMAELEFRKERLTAKQQAVNDVFDLVIVKIRNMAPEEYFKVLVNMVAATAVTGKEKIILPEQDKQRLPANFMDVVNQLLQDRGLAGNIEISGEVRPISSGFILTSEYTELNYTFESILRMNRDAYEAEVFSGLFSNTGTGAGA